MGWLSAHWHRADWLAVIAIALALASVTPTLAQFVEPPPLEYRNLPFPVLNSPVRPGDPLVMLISRCATRSAAEPYIVSRELVRVDDRLRLPLSPTRSMARVGCEEYRAQTAALPDDIDPGIYVYRGIATVPGWFRNRAIPWETEPFEILAASEDTP